ncbi:hypothetical protein BGZ80_007523 [Entomortierella chlamydospora]|uniref:Uncharacterized protein n=1 Tax=Entomortierella chlamydospora TaxID=101097 RepID=A0A9P6MEN4_9FUNG|nr:hypothetical protein BGZ79_005123 [Entomortierella chlamydospora]KAF9995401.1 hypothetical protein BGZ80_007523 [Entomortierella chlamydospora]
MDNPRLDLDSSVRLPLHDHNNQSSSSLQHQQQQKTKPPPLRKIPVREFESYSPPPIMTAPIYGSSKFSSISPPPFYSPLTNVTSGGGGNNINTTNGSPYNNDTNGHQNDYDYYRSYQNQDESYISSSGQQQQLVTEESSQQRQQNYIGTATGTSGNSMPRGDREREREGGYRSRPVSQYQTDPSSLTSLSPTSGIPVASTTTAIPTSKSRRPKSLATHEFTAEAGNGSASSSLLLGNEGSAYSQPRKGQGQDTAALDMNTKDMVGTKE